MKNKIIAFSFSLFLLMFGFACGRYRVPVAHAQTSTPSYACNPYLSAGGPFVNDCVQFVVFRSSARLGGGTFVYMVTQNPIDLSNGEQQPILVQSGFGSTQFFEPNSDTNTFTLGVTAP